MDYKDEGIEVNNAFSKDVKTMGMLCHLLSFAGYAGIPFGHIIGPLIMWLVKKEDSEFIDECGKEAINFQISLTIYSIVSVFLMFIFIGVFTFIALVIVNLVCVIKAAIKANEGIIYRYPITIRFIK